MLHVAAVFLPWPSQSKSTQVSELADDPTSKKRLETDSLSAMPVASLPPVNPISESQAIERPSQPAAVEQQPLAVPPQPVLPAPAVQAQLPQPVRPQPVPPQPAPPHVQQNSAIADPVQPSSHLSTQSLVDESVSHTLNHSSIEADPAQGTVMLLGEDFPDLEGAQSGCYGLAGCRQLNGNYRQVAEQLLAQLTAQGYQLSERGDIDDAGHRVFEAIAPHSDSPDDVYYLNIFSPDLGSAVYVIAVDILSLEKLQQLSR